MASEPLKQAIIKRCLAAANNIEHFKMNSKGSGAFETNDNAMCSSPFEDQWRKKIKQNLDDCHILTFETSN